MVNFIYIFSPQLKRNQQTYPENLSNLLYWFRYINLSLSMHLLIVLMRMFFLVLKLH